MGVSETFASYKAWSFYFLHKTFVTDKHSGKEINYTQLAIDLLKEDPLIVFTRYISAELVAKYILNPYKDFSECIHDQMKRHNMTKSDAIKRCKVFAAKGIHGGITSKKKKKKEGCDYHG